MNSQHHESNDSRKTENSSDDEARTGRLLGIAVGKRIRSNRVQNKHVSWNQLTERLSEFTVTGETMDEFLAMPRDMQLDIKDVGYFVGGCFDGGVRQGHRLRSRSLLVLDLDHLGSLVNVDKVRRAYCDYSYAMHSTHKHSQETPRLRLVMPLTRELTPLEYEPLARVVSSWSDFEFFDVTTFDQARAMFWPSCPSDGEPLFEQHEGAWLDPEWVLKASGIDINDPTTWPKSACRGDQPRREKASEDPTTKKGLIGAFCRVYSIHNAIATFDLPYLPGDTDNRYTYAHGSSANGAVVYRFDTILYSHHESDPTQGRANNAWDLVRIHQFGDEDIGTDTASVSPHLWPSYKSMCRLARDDDDVIQEFLDAEGIDVFPDEPDSHSANSADSPEEADATGKREADEGARGFPAGLLPPLAWSV